jgi:sulfonate transport system substrate-binding protein
VRVIESAGLQWEDIKPAYLSPADGRSAFEQGSVDAWAIWDPFYAVAQEEAKARVLRDSDGLTANRDFYLANREFARAHPEIINAIGEEVQTVAAWAADNPDEVAALLSPILGIEQPILETVNKRRDYSFEPITPEMVAEQQAIAVFAAKTQATRVGLDLSTRIFETVGSRATATKYGFDIKSG